MCHVSVGHVARAVEEAGISTVTIVVRAFRHVAQAMRLPRTVLTRNPMGRTLGAPKDMERQREVVKAALSLLEHASEAPAMVQMDDAFRPGGLRAFTEPGNRLP